MSDKNKIYICNLYLRIALGSVYSTKANGAEQTTEANNSEELRIPTFRRQTRWLFTSVAEDFLTQGYREKKSR